MKLKTFLNSMFQRVKKYISFDFFFLLVETDNILRHFATYSDIMFCLELKLKVVLQRIGDSMMQ